MVHSFKAEIFKLRKRPFIWCLSAAFLAVIVLIGYVFPYLVFQGVVKDSNDVEMIATFYSVLAGKNIGPRLLDVLWQFGGPFAMLLGTMTVGSEYGWNTWRTVLLQRGSRREALGGVILALGAVIGAWLVLAVVVALVAGFGINAAEGMSPSMPDVENLVPSLGAAWLGLAAWTVLGSALALAFRGAALATGLGLVYVLGVESIVGMASANIKIAAFFSKWMVGPSLKVFAHTLAPSGVEVPTPLVTPLQAMLVLTAIVAGAVAAMAALQRRDHA